MRNLRAAATLLAVAGIGVANCAALIATPTLAAPPAPVYSWSGFYGGVNLGGAWGSSNSTTSVNPNIGCAVPTCYFNPFVEPVFNAAGVQSFNTAGFTGGVEAGYNFQFDRLLVGVEGDVEALTLKGGTSATGILPLTTATFTVGANANSNVLTTIRWRAGFVAGSWLFFGTGGAAFSDAKASWAYSDTCGTNPTCNGGLAPNGVESASASARVGWTVGGGTEAKLFDQWTWKIEYLYVNFGTVSTTGYINSTVLAAFGLPPTASPFSHSMTLQANIVRVGLNYKFW
jgi:outer membrane immunogenic protein